ncbi:hypothetical protein UPYG_G00077180 [Umbra pygmaea]|uniref:WD repeat-containing protein 60 n=1 Tax=Umbra pygmaea TaxID=75934 RepID=A0ABD0XCY2_UMBPY
MEDTWKSEDLRRHLKGGRHDKESGRRRDENERSYRTGESVERHNRDPERDARKERENPRAERDGTRERTKPRDLENERHPDRRKDDSRDRTALRVEREKDKRREQDKDKGTDSARYQDGDGDRQHNRHDREGRENRERVKEREERTREREQEPQRERDKKVRKTSERDKEKERRGTGERDRKKDRERGPGERDTERRSERERWRGEEMGDRVRGHDRERRDRHMEREEIKHYTEAEKRRDKERKERPVNKDLSEQQGNKEHREQRSKGKEDRGRSHKDNGESQRYKGESREAERDRSHKDRRRIDGEREREMDTRGERRYRKGADLDRDSTERTQKLSPSDLRTHKEKADPAKTKEVVMQSKSAQRFSLRPLSDKEKPVETGEAPAVDQGSEDYEEDFEDYEEDFEDADESDGDDRQTPSDGKREEPEDVNTQRREEVLAIQRAIEEENQRVGSTYHKQHTDLDTPRTSKDSEIQSQDSHQHGRFINFVAAKHREVSKLVASKQKKRSTELLRLIDLDFSITFSMLDLPPVNEYDMYIKSFGTTNTKQAYVQCNEDNTDRDIQTEEIDVSEMWTQHPSERSVVCGGPNLSRDTSDEPGTNLSIDSQRLAKFLRSASQVVAVLLEEQRAERGSLERRKTQADALSFSDGCLQLNTKLPFLHDRQVSLLHFSQVQRQTMLSVHSPLTKPSAVRLDSKTIICIWNIWEPSCPQKVLVYESEVNCCCFSPGKATLVFAGTSVGSVVLWDLREHASLHHALRIGENEWTLRHPTFSTDAVLALSGHMSSVCSVEAVPATVAEGLRPELPLFTSDEDSLGLSFQLASLDENGVLNLWVVLELPKANDAGSQTDLGLRPGGRVKLLHSSTVVTTSERSLSGDAKKRPPFQALILKCLPADSNHFLICTNMGLVTHRTSHGLKASPKFYRPQVDGFRPVDVTSIDFSPSSEPIFLVGCEDGSVRLHTVQSEHPLMEWSSSTAGQPVISVRWALARPTVFCVLDAASRLHIWNLLEKDFEPVITESIDADRVTAMSVFGDPAKQNTYSGIALAMQSGKIEMQYFCRKFTVAEPADLNKLKSLVHEAF